MANNKKIYSLTLDPDLVEVVDAKARSQNRTRSNQIELELQRNMKRLTLNKLGVKTLEKKQLNTSEIGLKEDDKPVSSKIKGNWDKQPIKSHIAN
ncbi:hypothetical protein ACFLU5_17760 [Bacteroidota bacterium]